MNRAEHIPDYWVDHNATTIPTVPPRGWLVVVAALSSALFTTREGPPPEERIHWLCQEVSTHIKSSGHYVHFPFRFFIWSINWIGPLLSFRFIPLHRTEPAKRIALLNKLEHSRLLSMPVLAIKAILCILYYEHPDAAHEVGFDGQCLSESEKLSSAGDGI